MGLHMWAQGVLLWLSLAAPLGSQASADESPAAATSWVATTDGSLYRAARTLPIAGGTEVTTRRGRHILLLAENIATEWPDEDSRLLQSGQVITTRCRRNRYEPPLIRELTTVGEEPTQVQLVAISPGVSVRFRRPNGPTEEQRSWADIESIVRPKDRPDPCQPMELPSIPAGEEAEAERKEKHGATSSAQASASSSSDIRVRLESDRPIQLWEVVPHRDRRQIGEGLTMESLILHPDLEYEISGSGVNGADFRLEPQRSAQIFVQTGRPAHTAGGVVLISLGAMATGAGFFSLLTAGLVAAYNSSYHPPDSNNYTAWVALGVVGLGLGVAGLIGGVYLADDSETRVRIVSEYTGPAGKRIARLRVTSRGLEF